MRYDTIVFCVHGSVIQLAHFIRLNKTSHGYISNCFIAPDSFNVADQTK